jgi:hypothetical protein
VNGVRDDISSSRDDAPSTREWPAGEAAGKRLQDREVPLLDESTSRGTIVAAPVDRRKADFEDNDDASPANAYQTR